MKRQMSEYPEDIPWREIIKAAIPFLVILVVYFSVMAAISAPSIAWLIRGDRNVAAPAGEARGLIRGDRNVASPAGGAWGGDIPVAGEEVAK